MTRTYFCLILLVVYCTESLSTTTGCPDTSDLQLRAHLEAIVAQQKVLIGELYRLVKKTTGTNHDSERLIQMDFESLAAQRRAVNYQITHDVTASRRHSNEKDSHLTSQPEQKLLDANSKIDREEERVEEDVAP